MRAYEFNCKSCLNIFELWGTAEEHSNGLVKRCPFCGSLKIEEKHNPLSVIQGGKVGSGGSPCCGPKSGSGC
jgi:hypothetical protein